MKIKESYRILPKNVSSNQGDQEQLFHLGVKAFIHDAQGNILLLKRPNATSWDLPGGRVKQHEDPYDAFLREVEEETGITTLSHIQRHAIEYTTITLLSNKDIRLLIWYHTCRSETIHVVLSDEHVEYAWVPWQSARTKIAPLGQSEAIDQIVSTFRVIE